MNRDPFEAAKGKDIVDVIGRDVKLRGKGRLHVGLCPFHDDTDPSLMVYQDHFYCFGCGKGGDVITYVAEREGCSLLEAARKLIGGNFSLYRRRPVRKKPTAPVVPRWVVQYWHGKLAGRRVYFHSRGFTDATIDMLRFGWDGRRYTIPIYEDLDKPVRQVARRRCDEVEMKLLKREMPKADEATLHKAFPAKYLHLRGHGGHSLYGRWSLEGSELFVVFGLLTCATMIQDGFPCCSPSSGVESWQDEWAVHFQRADRVWVVQDSTPSERDATYMVAASIGGLARVVKTPLGFGDYNDFRVAGHSVEEFLEYVGV